MFNNTHSSAGHNHNNNNSSSLVLEQDPSSPNYLPSAYRQIDSAESWTQHWPFPDYRNNNSTTTTAQRSAATQKRREQQQGSIADGGRGGDITAKQRASSSLSSQSLSTQQQQSLRASLYQQQQVNRIRQSFASPSPSSFSRSIFNNSNNSTTTTISPTIIDGPVTATEFAILRSLFGRGEESHNQTTDTANKLLPHVDIRWLVGSDRNNTTNFSSKMPLFTQPTRFKTIGNLFQNIEAISENWSRRDYGGGGGHTTNTTNSGGGGGSGAVLVGYSMNTSNNNNNNSRGSSSIGGTSSSSSLAVVASATTPTNNNLITLINSPRSAVTLLRTGTDLHQLTLQVAAAHTVNPLEARQSSTSKQRVLDDKHHQRLAKERRQQLEIQDTVNRKLKQLSDVYVKICQQTELEDVFALRDAEHTKRQVIVPKKHFPSRIVNRSASASVRAHAVNEMSFQQAEESMLATQEKIELAKQRRKEMFDNRKLLESAKAARRGDIQHSQMRSKILNDINSRERAALQCQRVYNLEKKF